MATLGLMIAELVPMTSPLKLKMGPPEADDVAVQLAVVRELDDDIVGARDDVVVREHDARLVDDEAGAERLLLLDLRPRRGHPELLAEHLAPRVFDGHPPDDLRAL